MIIANRDDELAAFRELVQPTTKKRILIISGPKGSGKSFLLNKFESMCADEELANTVLMIRLDGRSIQKPIDLLDEVQRELDSLGRSNFEDLKAALDIGLANIAIEQNDVSGTLNLFISQPENQQRLNLPGILLGFFRDLRKIDRSIVLLFNRFHHSNDELASWIWGPFLSDVKRSKNVRFVLAGETNLPENFQWDGCCMRLPSLGPINDVQKWALYTDRLGLTVSREILIALIEITEGSPRALGNYFISKVNVVQTLLNELPENLVIALQAAAIPYWFNEEILKAILPDIANQAVHLYQQLRQLPFVEVYQGKGYKIHSRTRKQLLERLWQEHPARFSQLSENITNYFENEEDSTSKIEWLHHLSMTEIEGSYYDVLKTHSAGLRFAELQSLAKKLCDHIDINQNQVALAIKADIYNWLGDHHIDDNTEKSLSYLRQALAIYQEIGNLQGKARTYQNIGNIVKSIGSIEEALEKYNLALQLCEKLNDSNGQANALKGKGDISHHCQRYDEALLYYQQAFTLYSNLSDQADISFKLGEVLQALGRIRNAKSYYDAASELYEQKFFDEEITSEDTLGLANVLQKCGTLESDPIKALMYFGQANTFYNELSDLYRQSRNFIYFMAPSYKDSAQRIPEIKALQEGKRLAEKINHLELIQAAEERLAQLLERPT
jgi:tetratricopeptide (TPR) repeat protein